MSITREKKAEKPKAEPAEAHFFQTVIKGDTYQVMAHAAYSPEDEFKNLYVQAENSANVLVEPPFNPKRMLHLPQENNTLFQCVEAMEVNIDGTGWELVPADPKTPMDEEEKKRLESFFNEPYPGKDFISMRRDKRRDEESAGYAFFEVLKNVTGEPIGLRNVPTANMRLVKLDAEVLVEKKLVRDGKEISFMVWERERRYCQRVGAQFLYFRDFGATRHVDRSNGRWEGKQPDGSEHTVLPQDRGGDILMFKVKSDVDTAYGVPRWVNQMPSVIGSRKAEEQNLELLDSGGMPPAIFFIEGGTLTKEVAAQLNQYLSGTMKKKNRAAVVEVQSASGAIDSAGKVSVKTERFGAEASKDSMFANYDVRTADHVQQGFRLPPLFMGKAADYSFASASTSYMVAEAQVFQPERSAFDGVINRTLMKALGAKTCAFRSKPITLKDVATMLSGLEQAKDVSDPESWIKEMNTVAGLALEARDEPDEVAAAEANGQVQNKLHAAKGEIDLDLHDKKLAIEKKHGVAKIAPKPGAQATIKKGADDILQLANEFAAAEGLIPTKNPASESQLEVIRKSVNDLEPEEKALFGLFLSTHLESKAA